MNYLDSWYTKFCDIYNKKGIVPQEFCLKISNE